MRVLQQSSPDTQDPELSRAFQVIAWNRRLLSCIGVWPLRVLDPLFCLSFLYMVIHCSLGFADLVEGFSSLEMVVDNLTENVLLTMTAVKIGICRLNTKTMAPFLLDIEKDFVANAYESADEKVAFLRYNELTIKFLKASTTITAVAGSLYFMRLFPEKIAKARRNLTIEYTLPYHVHPGINIDDGTTYIMVCLYHAITVPTIICGYSGPDSFCVTMTLHICGQFGALSERIKRALTDPQGHHHGISKLVSSHHRLIRLAETLEERYNIIFLQQIVGSTFLLCLTSYNMISSSDASGNKANFIIFILYVTCVATTLFAYCYIGECLICESTRLFHELYNSKWYDIPAIHQKLIHICMTRAEKPLILTSGKFCVLSLSTFTDIIKTSMGYLSVLRNFL